MVRFVGYVRLLGRWFLEYCAVRRVTLVLVGKPGERGWARLPTTEFPKSIVLAYLSHANIRNT